VRLSVNARLREPDLDRILAACKAIAQSKAISPWPNALLKSAQSSSDSAISSKSLIADRRERQTTGAVSMLRGAAQELRKASDRWFNRNTTP
jgi:hypothetical protein